ncbi:14581_t:CDS:2 [Gigaspora margarita]|uniref:14581_t:CDS:1 n=1 Tax=Gigaspora margarita TaxID=4874 RepID=A0ABN7UWX6_GIGMA|nr:14581_t:CDS:2 [Gigaspora margarita]
MPYLRYVVGDFIVEEFEEEMSTSDKGKSLEYKVERTDSDRVSTNYFNSTAFIEKDIHFRLEGSEYIEQIIYRKNYNQGCAETIWGEEIKVNMNLETSIVWT